MKLIKLEQTVAIGNKIRLKLTFLIRLPCSIILLAPIIRLLEKKAGSPSRQQKHGERPIDFHSYDQRKNDGVVIICIKGVIKDQRNPKNDD